MDSPTTRIQVITMQVIRLNFGLLRVSSCCWRAASTLARSPLLPFSGLAPTLPPPFKLLSGRGKLAAAEDNTSFGPGLKQDILSRVHITSHHITSPDILTSPHAMPNAMQDSVPRLITGVGQTLFRGKRCISTSDFKLDCASLRPMVNAQQKT